MVTIGIDQTLSSSAMYEHKCLENIKKLYRSSVKCDNHHYYKAMIETEMVFTPDIFTENIPM